MSSSHSSTSFSMFVDPRPAPTPPGRSFRRYTLHRVVSESCISVKGLRLSSDDDVKLDPYIYNGAVRRGCVGVQRDNLRSWSWTRRLWVVLDNERLYVCQHKDSPASQVVHLRQVRRVELVQSRRFCLVVATASATLYLLFKDLVSLHAWFHDIRMNCPLMQIGKPTDFRHEMHVAYDAAAGEITGLPEPWIETLASWGMDPHRTYATARMQPDIATPLTEPQVSPVLPEPDEARDPTPREAPVLPPYVGRHRSASAVVAPSIAPSIALSTDQFRKSPNRFRDVDARNLTGAVQPVSLLPTSRTETCDIWKAEWIGSFGKRKVAIQVIRLSGVVSEGEQTQLSSIVLREVKALHQLRHTNVVRVRGFCQDQGPLPGFVSTWLPRGYLMKYLEYHRPSVGKGPRLKFIAEVAAGINYLHNFSRVILHGNLSGAQILISDRGTACVTGFGLNPILQEMEGESIGDDEYDPLTATATQPSPRWAAMEVIRKGRRHVTTSSDVFSFARTVVQIITGKDPFHYIPDDGEVVQTVLRGVLPRRSRGFGESDGLWTFLERCWVEDAKRRPSMALALLKIEEVYLFYNDPEKVQPEEPGSA